MGGMPATVVGLRAARSNEEYRKFVIKRSRKKITQTANTKMKQKNHIKLKTCMEHGVPDLRQVTAVLNMFLNSEV